MTASAMSATARAGRGCGWDPKRTDQDVAWVTEEAGPGGSPSQACNAVSIELVCAGLGEANLESEDTVLDDLPILKQHREYNKTND